MGTKLKIAPGITRGKVRTFFSNLYLLGTKIKKSKEDSNFVSFFYIYIYPGRLQERDGDAKHTVGQAITPTCLQRCQDIAVRLKFFIWFFAL